jgi:hypothetical protein
LGGEGEGLGELLVEAGHVGRAAPGDDEVAVAKLPGRQAGLEGDPDGLFGDQLGAGAEAGVDPVAVVELADAGGGRRWRSPTAGRRP